MKIANTVFALLFILCGKLSFGQNKTAPAKPAAIMTKTLKAKDGTIVYINGKLNIANAMVNIDSTTSPKFICLNIELNGITGSNFVEMLDANHLYTVSDKMKKPLPFKDRVLKKCGGSMEDNLVNYTIKLPYKLKTDPEKVYNINYMLESKAKDKSIQVVYTTK